MSTNISSRILRSSHSKRLQAIPWETLLHIFSYCDQPTLVAVSLVSFACWELAGPILYQDIEIVNLDGLASLFFIEIVPSSPCLQQTTSFLSRIKTLSLDLRFWTQKINPKFRRPASSEETGDDFENAELIPPLRLLSLSPDALPLQTLSIPADNGQYFSFFGWLGIQLFPRLNPTEVVRRNPQRPCFPNWPGRCDSTPREFLLSWTDLRRVVWDGYKIVVTPPFSIYAPYQEDGLYALWVPPEGEEEKRSMELVFEAAEEGDWEGMREGTQRTLDRLLSKGGVDERLVGRVDLKVSLRVRQEDEKVAKERVAKLGPWMRKVVRVEVV